MPRFESYLVLTLTLGGSRAGFLLPILQAAKLRFRVGKQLVSGHTGGGCPTCPAYSLTHPLGETHMVLAQCLGPQGVDWRGPF